MIMLIRPERKRLAGQLAGHAEVDSQPRLAAKPKEHLLATRPGFSEWLAEQRSGDLVSVNASKNPRLGVQLHAGNALTQPGVPLFAIVFDLGKFRHAAR